MPASHQADKLQAPVGNLRGMEFHRGPWVDLLFSSSCNLTRVQLHTPSKLELAEAPQHDATEVFRSDWSSRSKVVSGCGVLTMKPFSLFVFLLKIFATVEIKEIILFFFFHKVT